MINSLQFISNELEKVKDKLIFRNYSENTQTIYTHFIREYLCYCYKHGQDSSCETTSFLHSLIKRNLSISTQNQAINAIKFYWEKILLKPKGIIELDRPMKEKRLPTVLSIQEIKRLFQQINNQKHRMILATIYSCGLRISEIINLRISHIDSDRMCILIKQSKGRKDRLVPLPNQLLKAFRNYYLVYRPKEYLFEGIPKNHQPTPYSASSIRQILKRASIASKINKHISPHTLRHSYATHMYEHGVGLRTIQNLLGHSSSKTTEIYTHVSTSHVLKCPNPLDFIK